MAMLVDTSVWSLAFRRDTDSNAPQVAVLRSVLGGTETVVTTGLVMQELLQGFCGLRAARDIVAKFAALALIVPDRDDHIGAADLRNRCRRAGIQVGTIDALLAQLCIRHDLLLLTTDHDFTPVARHCPLRVWQPGS